MTLMTPNTGCVAVVALRDLYIYSGPSASQPVLWMLSKGNEVTVQSVIGGWAKFTVFNTYGYVQSAYLARKEVQPALTSTPS